MDISIIVPIYNQVTDRKIALSKVINSLNAQDCKEKFEVIFVEQESENISNIPNNFKHIVLPKQKAFNKSWCMNVGVKKATSDNIVFLDADMLFGKDFISKIAKYYRDNNLSFFICWQFIITMDGKDNPITRVITPNILTAGGAFFVKKTFFYQAGQMHENYFGYGGEDNDFWVRANLQLGSLPNRMPYALLHWYHDWSPPSEDRFYPLNRTIQHTNTVIYRLSTANLGNESKPTLINIDDLQLNKSGIEEKDGEGF